MNVEFLLSRLKAQGFRITKGRIGMLSVLQKLSQPVSAQELQILLKKNGTKLNTVTVYRDLSMLAQAGMAQAVTFEDGIQRYELLPDDGHMHHLVCTSCKNVENIDMKHDDLHVLERSIGKKKKFQILSHALAFYGLCSRCS